MAASQQQKVDFLLKKIGYTASKTGLAEDSSLTGTKKAPFAEAVPSPLVIANTSVWAESNQIPATPPGTDSAQVKVYLSGTSGHRMTVDSTVSGNRSYIAYSTYNDNTSAILGDWIDTQFGSSYIVKVYKGDPNSGGVSLSAAGSGSSDGWFFDYSSGILNFNDTNVPTGVTDTNIYIVAYRYIGKKGVITVGAATSISSLDVSGVSTFTGNIDANGSIDVDGQAEFDDVNISGVVTAAQFSGGSGGGTVIGEDIVTRNLTVSVGSTFSGAADFNGGADITGGLVANSAKVSDLTAGRVVVAGTDGELEDASTFTFTGGTVTATNFSGNLTGTLQTAAQTNITSVGTLSAVTVSGDITANGNIAGDSATNITGIAGVTASTLTGTLQTAAQTNITSVGTLTGLDVNGHTELDNVNVSGVSTFTGAIDANGGLDVAGGEATLASAVVSDLTSGRVVTAGTSGALQDSANLTFVADKLGVTGGLQVSAGATFGDVNVDGKTDLDDLSVTGVATFSALVDGNAGANFSGAETVLSSATVSDLTDNRVVLAGTSGALEDSSKITFDGTTFAIVGDATFTGNVSVAGTLTSEDKTDLDVIGIVTARTGVRINSGGLVVSSGVNTFTDAIDANGGANIAGGFVANSAKVSDLTSGRVVVAGTDGELEDASTFTFSGGTVTATAFAGSGAALTNLPTGISTTGTSDFTTLNVSTLLDVDGHTELDFVNVSAAATFAALVTGGAGANFSGAETVLSSATVSDLTEGRVVVAGVSGALEDASTFTFSGGTVSATNFSGNLTGTLQTAAQTNITSVGSLSVLNVAGNIIQSKSSSDTNFYVKSLPPSESGLYVQNPNTTDGTYSSIGIISKNSSSTDQSVSIIAKSVAGGYRPEVHITQRTNANAQTSAISINTSGAVTLSHDGSSKIVTTSTGAVVTGVLTATSFSGTLDTAAQTNITSVGTLGSLTVSGDITANGNIAGDNSTNITGIAGVTATTLTGALQTAAQTNITSVGTLSNLTVSGNITANGNIVGDDATDITGIDAVIASTLAGTLQTAAQTNITSVGTLTGLNVNGHTDLDNTYISGITTFFHDVVISDTIRHDGDDNSKIRFLSGDTVSIETDNAERFRIVKGGGVGIGTTNPTAAVTSANTAVLAAGIVTAYQLYGDGSNLSGVGFEPTTGDSGTGNLYAGTEAGNASDTDTYCNVALGYRAGKTLNSGDFNVFLGTNAGCHADAGLNNISIGCNAAKTLTSGSDNIALGQAAMGTGVVTGNCNIALGRQAGQNISDGQYNIFFGKYAGNGNTGGDCNIMIGCNAGKGITTANENISIGGLGLQKAAGNMNVQIGRYGQHYMCGACNISMGQNAMQGTTTAADNLGHTNIALGNSAMFYQKTGCYNIGLGYQSLYGAAAGTTGNYNDAFGYQTGKSLTTGSGNLLLGTQAGMNLTTAAGNVYAGNSAARCMCNGDYNIALGYLALQGSTTVSDNTGHSNVAIGKNAGCVITSGTYNVLIGNAAGDAITSGSNLIAIGCAALSSEDTTSYAVAIGYNALTLQNGDWGNNVAIGKDAGATLTEATENVFMGYSAGSGVTTGCRVVALGSLTLTASTTGGDNVVIGGDSGRSNTGSNNVIIGACAGDASGDGSGNTLLGNSAGGAVTNGDRNSFLGACAGDAVTTGCCNVAIGHGADVASATGNNQLAIGIAANNWITGDSSYNVCLAGSNIKAIASGGVFCATEFVGGGAGLTGIAAGFEADADVNLFASNTCSGCSLDGSSGCFNIFLGACAGKVVADGEKNIFLGYRAGKAVTSGSGNILLGEDAGTALNTALCNIVMGKDAMCTATTSCCNVVIGIRAGSCMTTTSNDNVFIGFYAGRRVTAGAINNIAIGRQTGPFTSDSTGKCNIFLGSVNGNATTTGCNNIAIGDYAGQGNTEGKWNISMGLYAGSACATTKCLNISIGRCTNLRTFGQCNLAIGSNAGQGTVPSSAGDNTGENNIFLGSDSGRCITEGGCNVVGGINALCKITTGNCNVAFGPSAGKNLTTGINNVFIGSNVAATGTITGFNNLAMGGAFAGANLAGANGNVLLSSFAGCSLTSGSCNVIIGYNAGKEVSTNGYNVFLGTYAGQYGNGNSNVFIGQFAGRGVTGCGNGENAFVGCKSGFAIETGTLNAFLGGTSGCSITTGHCNAVVGAKGAMVLSTGSQNTFLGSYGGNNVTTGSCNVSVGFNVALPSATADKQMAVGIATSRWITGYTDFSIGGVFKNYAETYSAIGNAGSTPTIDLEDGNVFSATLNSNATFTFTMGLNLPQTATSFTLILTNDGTPSRTISWPASVKWPNNSVPSRTTAASKTDIWSFMTPDGGTTWYGNIALYNFT